MSFLESSLVQSGKFIDIHPIGQGGYGQVYYAIDTRLQRPVAIKEARPSTEDFQWTLEKFAKESRIQARLQHPNIVAVYALEEDVSTNEHYLICECANAGSLADYIEAHGPLTEAQAVKVTLDICAAIERIWSEHIVHRDIKPSNILLNKDSEGNLTAKLGDFGIAQDQSRRPTTMRPGTQHPGTPEYMAPEQGSSSNLLDVRADLYALGATLFEMLSLQVYSYHKQKGSSYLQEYNAFASRGITAVIEKAVQEDTLERYQLPRDLIEDLQAVQHGERPIIAESIPAIPRNHRLSVVKWRRFFAAVLWLLLGAALTFTPFGVRWIENNIPNGNQSQISQVSVATITNAPVAGKKCTPLNHRVAQDQTIVEICTWIEIDGSTHMARAHGSVTHKDGPLTAALSIYAIHLNYDGITRTGLATGVDFKNVSTQTDAWDCQGGSAFSSEVGARIIYPDGSQPTYTVKSDPIRLGC